MLMHAIAHDGCTDNVRESALDVDSGRNFPRRTKDFSVGRSTNYLGPVRYQQHFTIPDYADFWMS